MQSRIIGTFWVTTICCIVSVLALMGVPAECYDVNVSITPSRIILNAECVGSFQDIQAILPFVLPPKCKFVEGSFGADFFLKREGEEEEKPICHTSSFHYCAEDDNLLVSFDRGAIQNYEGGLEAGVYDARVSCIFKIECDDGSGTPVTHTIELEGTDSVEILAPGKKKK